MPSMSPGNRSNIKDLYGLASEGPVVDDSVINVKAETEFFGRKCLVARRLLERGVRFGADLERE